MKSLKALLFFILLIIPFMYYFSDISNRFYKLNIFYRSPTLVPNCFEASHPILCFSFFVIHKLLFPSQ